MHMWPFIWRTKLNSLYPRVIYAKFSKWNWPMQWFCRRRLLNSFVNVFLLLRLSSHGKGHVNCNIYTFVLYNCSHATCNIYNVLILYSRLYKNTWGICEGTSKQSSGPLQPPPTPLDSCMDPPLHFGDIFAYFVLVSSPRLPQFQLTSDVDVHNQWISTITIGFVEQTLIILHQKYKKLKSHTTHNYSCSLASGA